MKRYLINYSTGLMEQTGALDNTLMRQLANRVVSYIVDTQQGILTIANEKGEIGNYPIPDVDLPEEETVQPKPEKK